VNVKSSVPRRGAVVGIAALALLAACSKPPSKTASGAASKAATATSVADVGGLDALVAAAKKEGTLNVIALPPDWANYGKQISTFSSKYGIKITSAQPDASSQDEINAAKQLASTSRAPDVFDVGLNIALANTALFAPY
jgi:putative spermidine/putrescine transport system substrate-binding protein